MWWKAALWADCQSILLQLDQSLSGHTPHQIHVHSIYLRRNTSFLYAPIMLQLLLPWWSYNSSWGSMGTSWAKDTVYWRDRFQNSTRKLGWIQFSDEWAAWMTYMFIVLWVIFVFLSMLLGFLYGPLYLPSDISNQLATEVDTVLCFNLECSNRLKGTCRANTAPCPAQNEDLMDNVRLSDYMAR